MRSEPLTPAEWKVMRIVWALKECAARDVYEEAAQRHEWAPTTTKTVLRRLTDKGVLKTRQVGNSFLYRPARSALQSLVGAADVLLENVLEGTAGPLLSHMVKKSRLSAAEMADLRNLLDERSRGREG